MGIIGLNLYITKYLHFPLWTLQGQVYLSFCGSNENKKKTLPCVRWIYFIRIKGLGSTYKYNPTKKNSTSSVSLNKIFTALHKQIETPWLLDPIGIFKFCFIIAVWSTEATKRGWGGGWGGVLLEQEANFYHFFQRITWETQPAEVITYGRILLEAAYFWLHWEI